MFANRVESVCLPIVCLFSMHLHRPTQAMCRCQRWQYHHELPCCSLSRGRGRGSCLNDSLGSVPYWFYFITLPSAASGRRYILGMCTSTSSSPQTQETPSQTPATWWVVQAQRLRALPLILPDPPTSSSHHPNLHLHSPTTLSTTHSNFPLPSPNPSTSLPAAPLLLQAGPHVVQRACGRALGRRQGATHAQRDRLGTHKGPPPPHQAPGARGQVLLSARVSVWVEECGFEDAKLCSTHG